MNRHPSVRPSVRLSPIHCLSLTTETFLWESFGRAERNNQDSVWTGWLVSPVLRLCPLCPCCVLHIWVFFCPKELSVVPVKEDSTLKSPLKKLLSVSVTEELLKRTGAKPGDLLLIAAGSLHTVVGESLSWSETWDKSWTEHMFTHLSSYQSHPTSPWWSHHCSAVSALCWVASACSVRSF